jgi:predicted regulator of Ras-like GTPase activity (Roadblock/LC7/MglB family)
MPEDALLAEMRALRDRVVGITDTALASRDGLIIRADTGDIDPDYLAAMAAASLGLARRMAAEVGKGTLHEAVSRSSGGYVATYAVGDTALLVLVGDAGLDSARLRRESQATIKSLELLLSGAEPGPGEAAGLLSRVG